MNITKTYTKEDYIAAIDPYLEKFDNNSLDVENDSTLFFRALFGAIHQSRDETEDDMKMDLWENIQMDIEEFGTIGYFIEIRGKNMKYILRVDPDNLNFVEYEGEHDMNCEFLEGCKHKIWMDWVPSVQVNLLRGDPNMSAAFFSGDVKVIGSTKLGAKPRDWIYDFMAYLDRE
ncbi:MAG: hypothetical protein JW891_17485 [Candidatus Lokiarchaeota archaeon]|nr:hypothetical protein [Candidatus Lokiarchaeota archaeon]